MPVLQLLAVPGAGALQLALVALQLAVLVGLVVLQLAARGVGITAVVAGALASFAAVVPVAAVAGAGAWLYSSMSCAGEASERESSGLVLLGRGNFGSMHRDGDVAVKRNSNGAVRREAELLERCQSEFVVQLIRSNGEALWMELCCGGALATHAGAAQSRAKPHDVSEEGCRAAACGRWAPSRSGCHSSGPESRQCFADCHFDSAPGRFWFGRLQHKFAVG